MSFMRSFFPLLSASTFYFKILFIYSFIFQFIKVVYRRQLDLFQFLEDISPVTQEASSVLTNWRGVGSLLNPVRMCSFRVVRATSGSN